MATLFLSEGDVKARHIAADAAVEHSKMAQRVLAILNQNLMNARVWDAIQTNLPGTAATDDLGLIGVTYGATPPEIQAGDLKAAGATNRYCRLLVPVPEDYEAGQTIQIRVVAGMRTTVADVSCTVDVQAWRIDEDNSLGAADLVSTAAVTINSLTYANKDFTVDGATLTPGDMLDVRITIACNDAATVGAVLPCIAAIKLLADLR